MYFCIANWKKIFTKRKIFCQLHNEAKENPEKKRFYLMFVYTTKKKPQLSIKRIVPENMLIISRPLESSSCK
jgi:hypothetical protein